MSNDKPGKQRRVAPGKPRRNTADDGGRQPQPGDRGGNRRILRVPPTKIKRIV